jgi:hypothetical protein
MPTTITLDDDVDAFIRVHGKFGETYSDVFRRLLPGFGDPLHESAEVIYVHKGEEASNAPARDKLFGHSVCAVIRWMGREGWRYPDVRRVLNSYGLDHYSDTTIYCQLRWENRGVPADLSDAEIAQLRERRQN